MHKRYLYISLFLLGIFLLILNGYGFLVPLKNPSIYTEPKTGFENDAVLTPAETFRQLSELEALSKKETVEKATSILSRSMAHYWESTPDYQYGITVPFYHNWILASLQFIYPSVYKQYEYCNYKDAIKRGIGLCSQHAITLTDFLNRHNINSFVVGLDGHVVSTAEIAPDVWWVLDPDFGLVIPHSLDTIEHSPQLVAPYYENISSIKRSYGDPKDFPAIYAESGNIIYLGASIGNVSYIDCNWKKVLIEKTARFLIWLIPLFLMVPFSVNLYRKKYA
jgi:hypothetical protein